jgi:hypothetical protein
MRNRFQTIDCSCVILSVVNIDKSECHVFTLAACCGFHMCHKYILYLYFYLFVLTTGKELRGNYLACGERQVETGSYSRQFRRVAFLRSSSCCSFVLCYVMRHHHHVRSSGLTACVDAGFCIGLCGHGIPVSGVSMLNTGERCEQDERA